MLTHYVIVRRDLPLDVMSAMLVHAAGESAVYYQDSYDGRFRGARVVVLEVKDEFYLHRAKLKLLEADVQYVEVVESGEMYHGQLMAIGLVPVESEAIEPVMRHFLTL